MYACSPIKGVAIVCDKDVWLDVKDVIKEFPQQRKLIWFIEDNERSLVLWLGGVLKVLYVSSNHLTIRYQVALEWEWRIRIEQILNAPISDTCM